VLTKLDLIKEVIMSLEKEKVELLSENGYINHFKRSLYFNREARKIFSIVAVADHDINWVRVNIQAPNDTGTWQFYFNEPVSEQTRSEILHEFGV
jgi:hypothetical protein